MRHAAGLQGGSMQPAQGADPRRDFRPADSVGRLKRRVRRGSVRSILPAALDRVRYRQFRCQAAMDRADQVVSRSTCAARREVVWLKAKSLFASCVPKLQKNQNFAQIRMSVADSATRTTDSGIRD